MRRSSVAAARYGCAIDFQSCRGPPADSHGVVCFDQRTLRIARRGRLYRRFARHRESRQAERQDKNRQPPKVRIRSLHPLSHSRSPFCRCIARRRSTAMEHGAYQRTSLSFWPLWRRPGIRAVRFLHGCTSVGIGTRLFHRRLRLMRLNVHSYSRLTRSRSIATRVPAPWRQCDRRSPFRAGAAIVPTDMVSALERMRAHWQELHRRGKAYRHVLPTNAPRRGEQAIRTRVLRRRCGRLGVRNLSV
jgi:hypothetical protein